MSERGQAFQMLLAERLEPDLAVGDHPPILREAAAPGRGSDGRDVRLVAHRAGDVTDVQQADPPFVEPDLCVARLASRASG